MDPGAAAVTPSTLPKTKMTKKEFRERCKEMKLQREKRVMFHEMMCTPDSGLKRIQKGALSMGHVNYAFFIKGFREAVIEDTKKN